jgi:sulfur carrier protein ThiS
MQGGTLLQRLDLRREEVILIRNGEVITEKDWVTHEDEVEVIRVISGG